MRRNLATTYLVVNLGAGTRWAGTASARRHAACHELDHVEVMRLAERRLRVLLAIRQCSISTVTA